MTSAVLPTQTYVVNSLEFRLTSRELHVAGKKVNLSGLEYDILEWIAVRKDIVTTKKMLSERFFPNETIVRDKQFDILFFKIFKKIPHGCVEVVKGRGYIIREHRPPEDIYQVLKNGSPQSIKLPDGSTLWRAELPSPRTRGWQTTHRKTLLLAVCFKLITMSEAILAYQTSVEELQAWIPETSRRKITIGTKV